MEENFNNNPEEQPSMDNPFDETQQEVPLTPEQVGQLEALAQAEQGEVTNEIVSDPYRIAEILAYAIANDIIVYLSYNKLKDNTSQAYEVEPLEIKSHGSHPGGYLWVYDITAQRLKSFLLGNIEFVQLTNNHFIRMIH